MIDKTFRVLHSASSCLGLHSASWPLPFSWKPLWPPAVSFPPSGFYFLPVNCMADTPFSYFYLLPKPLSFMRTGVSSLPLQNPLILHGTVVVPGMLGDVMYEKVSVAGARGGLCHLSALSGHSSVWIFPGIPAMLKSVVKETMTKSWDLNACKLHVCTWDV